MKWLIALLCLSVCLGCGRKPAPLPPLPPCPGPKTLALVSVGVANSAVIERVRSYCELNLNAQVRALKPVEAVNGTLLDVGQAVTPLRESCDSVLLAVVWPIPDIEVHAEMLMSNRVFVVNARIMKPDDGDLEKYSRRLERQVMRGFAVTSGLELCPNPTCALFPYDNLQQLDEIGRNLCPPCNAKFEAAATAASLVKKFE